LELRNGLDGSVWLRSSDSVTDGGVSTVELAGDEVTTTVNSGIHSAIKKAKGSFAEEVVTDFFVGSFDCSDVCEHLA